MAATYNTSLANLSDHIRLALGDTDTAAALLADETIDAKLGLFPYAEALAQLAEGLISLFGQKPSKHGEAGGLTVEWAERVDAWKDLVKAARSGAIAPPTLTRTPRSGMAIQATTAQAMTASTARTVADVPTIMEGFRAD